MENDNIGSDYCRCCGAILENGIICKSCRDKYKPIENQNQLNSKEVNKWQIEKKELQNLLTN